MHCDFKPGLAPVSSSLWCEASVVRAISVLAPSAIKVSFKLKQLHNLSKVSSCRWIGVYIHKLNRSIRLWHEGDIFGGSHHLLLLCLVAGQVHLPSGWSSTDFHRPISRCPLSPCLCLRSKTQCPKYPCQPFSSGSCEFPSLSLQQDDRPWLDNWTQRLLSAKE